VRIDIHVGEIRVAAPTQAERVRMLPFSSNLPVGLASAAASRVGAATADFTDVNIDAHENEIGRRLGWAERRVDLPAGGTRRCCRRRGCRPIDLRLHQRLGPRFRRGRTVYSKPGGAAGSASGWPICR